MLRNPQKRMIEQNWEKLIATLRDSLVICPHCHEETFIEEGKNTCMDCGKPIDTSLQLKLGARNLYLTDGTKLYIDHDNTADVQVLKIISGAGEVAEIYTFKGTKLRHIKVETAYKYY